MVVPYPAVLPFRMQQLGYNASQQPLPLLSPCAPSCFEPADCRIAFSHGRPEALIPEELHVAASERAMKPDDSV